MAVLGVNYGRLCEHCYKQIHGQAAFNMLGVYHKRCYAIAEREAKEELARCKKAAETAMREATSRQNKNK